MLRIVCITVHPMNHIWRISNLHYALSMLWLTLQTIFSELVIYAVCTFVKFIRYFNRLKVVLG